MSKITKQITLDVSSPNCTRFVSSKQNDISSRFLNVTLTDGGEVIRIPSDAEAVMNVRRPDGEKAYLHGEILENGSVTFPLSGWVSAVEGCSRCDVSVYDGGEKLTAMTFMVESEGAVTTDEELEDDENYSEFSSLLASLQSLSSSEAARASAESARENAETLRVSSESARAGAEALRVTAESLRANAETLRASNEALRTTFIPSVSAAGVISWTNDKNLENPAPVNIKGPAPVKGTDYWTESDKAEIHDYIDTMILGGEW